MGIASIGPLSSARSSTGRLSSYRVCVGGEEEKAAGDDECGSTVESALLSPFGTGGGGIGLSQEGTQSMSCTIVSTLSAGNDGERERNEDGLAFFLARRVTG